MLCERCKIREANIRYTEVVNGVKNEHNLCTQCAQATELGHYAAFFDGEFPLNKLLSGILGMEAGGEQEDANEAGKVVCPTCGTSYNEFVNNSCFGCADCYSMFDLLIGESIRNLQGSDSHVGKRPRRENETADGDQVLNPATADLPVTEQLVILDSKLKEAVKNEEYELAAKYRDEIKSLREGGETNE